MYLNNFPMYVSLIYLANFIFIDCIVMTYFYIQGPPGAPGDRGPRGHRVRDGVYLMKYLSITTVHEIV